MLNAIEEMTSPTDGAQSEEEEENDVDPELLL